MTSIVVADAGPLIGLARAGRLELLQRLYESVWIPPAVRDELQVNSKRPGASRLESALASGWLEIHDLPESAGTSLTQLAPLVDAGEAEAIVLELAQEGYRLSSRLVHEIARLADEPTD